MTETKNRIEWADAARGLAIVLVVLHHAILYSGAGDMAASQWGTITEVLRTMRMPLFFLAAGLFAGKWTRAPWPNLLRSKVLLFGWVFVLWVVIRWAVFNLVPGDDEETGWPMLALHMIWPLGGWFIFVLAVFFVVARATAFIDRRIQLAVAAALSIVWFSEAIVIGNHAYDGVFTFYVFFVFGCYWRDWITEIAAKLNWMVCAGIIVAWLAAVGALGVLEMVDTPVLGFALRILGLAAGVSLAVSLSRVGGLRSLGRQTLPIYMVHSVLLFALVAALVWFGAPGLPAVNWWMPPLLAMIALLLSLGIGRLAPRVGASWLFETPRWLDRAAHRQAVRNR